MKPGLITVSLKEAIEGQQFVSDEQVTPAVKKWSILQSKEFYQVGIHALIHHWTATGRLH